MLKSVQRETCAHVHQLIVTNEQFHLAMHREGGCFCFFETVLLCSPAVLELAL